MLKILQARLQQYMNYELPVVQAGFRKGRGTRDQIANILWIMEKTREFQKKYLFLLYWLCQSLWLCGAGVQSRWIQGLRRGDRVGVLRKNYLIRKEKLGKNVVDKKIEERKRLIFLGLHREPVKLWDKKFALFTEATGALPVSRGNEHAERLPHSGLRNPDR